METGTGSTLTPGVVSIECVSPLYHQRIEKSYFGPLSIEDHLIYTQCEHGKRGVCFSVGLTEIKPEGWCISVQGLHALERECLCLVRPSTDWVSFSNNPIRDSHLNIHNLMT